MSEEANMSVESVEDYAHELEGFLGKRPSPGSHSPATEDLLDSKTGSEDLDSSKESLASSSDDDDSDLDILDIRAGGQLEDLAPQIRSGLRAPNYNGYRTFPSLLLWDEQGLKGFEEVTYSPHYYLTNTEIELLEKHGHAIAQIIKPGTILLELGSGCLRKIDILLRAIDALGVEVDYYALDLDRNELARSLRDLGPSNFKHVRCHGLFGTYDDGQAWLSKAENAQRPRCVLSLGSTIGSFTRAEAGDFLGTWATTLRPSDDSQVEGEAPPSSHNDGHIIIGLDGSKDGDRVFRAYNDRPRANTRFILNTLDHANDVLGYEAFKKQDWDVEGEWDAEGGRHNQYLVPRTNVKFEDIQLEAGERVFVVHSHKYDEAEQSQLWQASKLRAVQKYLNADGWYGVHVLAPA
ncbi:hypothetical protein LTR36_001887 [Oleoguttula mirabilis]|uniref:Histidine-specific methyltransferase SAM-dependent domain-containing protein n=1 Tax=Oleoguttula mirabilis TaxID=1507867 RepID=A0AAV9JNX7_9PEZI|nr:hypothetical protein LTR36_001887 [Oleoguttula mirabilis]